MADKKITQLTNITGANLVDADEFVVVDISADETKAITLGELKEAFDSGSGFVRITGDTMTGPLDVQSTITSDGLTVDGDVGIGTSSPSALLHIDGSAGDLIKVTSPSVGTGYIGIENGYTYINANTGGASLRFETQGTERMRIDSSGNVGIGTSSPNQPLHVIGNTQSTGSFLAGSSLNAATPDYTFLSDTSLGMFRLPNVLGFSVAGSERMRLDSSGNLLVGKTVTTYNTAGISLYAGGAGQFTASGNRAMYLNRLSTDGDILQFDKDGSTVGSIGTFNDYMTVGSGDTGLLMYNGGDVIRPHNMSSNTARDNAIDLGSTSDRFKDLYLSGGVSNPSGSLTFDTTGGEAMRIDSSGNVGIGTSSPSAPIDKFIQVYQPSTGNAGIKLNSGSTTGLDFIQNQLGESFIYNRDNSYLAFGTNNSERMRIDSNGNLLVGKTSFDATATGSILSNNGELWVTRSNSTPVYIRRLSTDGTLIQFNKDGTTVGSISVTGSSTAYNTSSDYRLKEDVQPMTGASDRVLDLKPVNFAWKADGSRVDGFLAHELQEVVPGAAHGVKDEVDDEGNPVYQGIDQSKLVPLLTAALQEALTEIADLKVRITALEG